MVNHRIRKEISNILLVRRNIRRIIAAFQGVIMLVYNPANCITGTSIPTLND